MFAAANPQILQRFETKSNGFGLEAEAVVAGVAHTLALANGGVSSLKAYLSAMGHSFDLTLEANKSQLQIVLTRLLHDQKKVNAVMKPFAKKTNRSICSVRIEIVSTSMSAHVRTYACMYVPVRMYV